MNLYEIDKAILACIDPETGELLDEAAIPAAYMTEKITCIPDKTAIKAAIKGGEVVPGVALVENLSVQIK